jgi:hypothetical protein
MALSDTFNKGNPRFAPHFPLRTLRTTSVLLSQTARTELSHRKQLYALTYRIK